MHISGDTKFEHSQAPSGSRNTVITVAERSRCLSVEWVGRHFS